MIAAVTSRLRRLALLLACLLSAGAVAHAEQVTLVDVLGRSVTLQAPARRVVLGQGRQLNALGFLHPDPVSLIAGWGDDFERQNREAFQLYRAKFPAIATLATVGNGTAGGFSFEKAVALEPDLVVLSLSIVGPDHRADGLIAKFEAARIPVIVVDFYLQPLRDTVPSLRALGKAIGREAATEAFIRFYEDHRRLVADRIAGAERPLVFINAHAGSGDCCSSPGRGTLHDFIVAAGGRNMAADLVPGAHGPVSLERLLEDDPAIYIATGGTHLARIGGFVLGLGVPEEEARRSFAALVARPGLAALTAVRSGHAHGLWHLFNDTPLHIVAIERMAKWIHPERFADVDPSATLAEIAARFSAIPLDGTLWVDGPGTSP